MSSGHGRDWPHLAVSIGKIAVYFVIASILSVMVFGTYDLLRILVDDLINPDPYYYAISVSRALQLFSYALTLVVGYELLKTVKLMLTSSYIPVGDIAKIAGIALLNHFITLDYHHVDPALLASMCFLLLVLFIGIVAFEWLARQKSNSSGH